MTTHSDDFEDVNSLFDFGHSRVFDILLVVYACRLSVIAADAIVLASTLTKTVPEWIEARRVIAVPLSTAIIQDGMYPVNLISSNIDYPLFSGSAYFLLVPCSGKFSIDLTTCHQHTPGHEHIPNDHLFGLGRLARVS